MPSKKRKAKGDSDSNRPAKRKSAPRAAKVNRNDPDWLVTSENSPLVYEDLHAELADPKTYENFTKEDWDDIREILPPNVPVNSDGYSIPFEFFRYDPDFRRGIREFQEDLSSGRLEPEWQAAAATAMEERASGKFDAYKEEQFEEFWGQKQKLDHGALAGDSAKLKLDILVENGVFKLGDIFSYSRVIGRGKGRFLIEKECEITNIEGHTLTFSVPPGQLKFARYMPASQPPADPRKHGVKETANGDDPSSLTATTSLNYIETTTDVEPNSTTFSADSEYKHGKTAANTDSKGGDTRAITNLESKGSMTDTIEQANGNLEESASVESGESEAKTPSQNDDALGNLPVKVGTPSTTTRSKARKSRTVSKPEIKEHLRDGKPDNNLSPAVTYEASSEPAESVHKTPTEPQKDVIYHSITNLKQLEDKITEIDGRMKGTDARSSNNTWKALRCKRNNQDLGSLFEVREDFYVWKHPQIVKTPKKRDHEHTGRLRK